MSKPKLPPFETKKESDKDKQVHFKSLREDEKKEKKHKKRKTRERRKTIAEKSEDSTKDKTAAEVMDPPPKKEHKKSERKKDGNKGHRKRSTSKKKEEADINKTKERPVKKDEIISDAKPAVAAKDKKEPQTMDAKETVGDYVRLTSYLLVEPISGYLTERF